MLRADWFIHCDIDEIRCAPWPGVSLRDGIYRVEREGYNAINHTVVDFHPVDNGFHRNVDFEDYFRHFTFGSQPADFVRVNAWKNTGQPVSLAARAGHQVIFENRRIYPYKFLSKHYSIRSQEQGTQKVFREWRQRPFPAARPAWWPAHGGALQENYSFLKDPSGLAYFDPDHFYGQYLAERLTGIGTMLPQSVEIRKARKKGGGI
jgi:hypothetical protein